MVKIFSGEFDVFRYLIFKNYNSSCVFNSFLYFWLIQQYFLVYIRFHNNIEWILFKLTFSIILHSCSCVQSVYIKPLSHPLANFFIANIHQIIILFLSNSARGKKMSILFFRSSVRPFLSFNFFSVLYNIIIPPILQVLLRTHCSHRLLRSGCQYPAP